MLGAIRRIFISSMAGSLLLGMQGEPPQLTDRSAQVMYTRTLGKLRAHLQDATTSEKRVIIHQLIQDFANHYGAYQIPMPQARRPLPAVLNISGELIAPVGPNDRNGFMHRQSTSAFKKVGTVPSPPPNSFASSGGSSDEEGDTV